MPGAQVLIFGNPLAGTRLMTKDLYVSFDLPPGLLRNRRY